MKPIISIVFEEIDSEYSWAHYDSEFKVIVQMRTGYINITQLENFAADRVGSIFSQWKEIDKARELIGAASITENVPVSELFIMIGGSALCVVRGVYGHPKLVSHIAFWIKPELAIKVSDVVSAYFIREAECTCVHAVRSQKLEMQQLVDNMKKLHKETSARLYLEQIAEQTSQIADRVVQIQESLDSYRKALGQIPESLSPEQDNECDFIVLGQFIDYAHL